MKLGPLFEEVLREEETKRKALNDVAILLEKQIRVGANLENRLKSIANNNFATNILNFLNSDKIKDDATVDYIDYNKENEKLFTIGYTDREGNTKERLMKLNKLMTYLGGDMSKVKGYEVEDVMNHLKKSNTDNFKLLDGEDIRKAYLCDNSDEGRLSSCMASRQAQPYLEIYVANPNQVKLLALMNPDNGKVRGRALVWTMDDGTRFMDRIYNVDKEEAANFHSYADENNISRITPSGKVTLDTKGEYDEYPYLDTLMYYNPYTGVLTGNGALTKGDDQADWLTLTDTGGGHEDDRNQWSEVHQENIPEDQAVYIDHIEDYVYDTEVVSSWKEDEWLYRDSDDVVWVDTGEYENSWALRRDTVTTYDNKTAIGEDVYELEAGDHYGEYAVGEDITETVEGLIVLEDDTVEITEGQHSGMRTVPENAYKLTTGPAEGAIIHEDDFDGYEKFAPVELSPDPLGD